MKTLIDVVRVKLGFIDMFRVLVLRIFIYLIVYCYSQLNKNFKARGSSKGVSFKICKLSSNLTTPFRKKTLFILLKKAFFIIAYKDFYDKSSQIPKRVEIFKVKIHSN